MDSGMVLMGIVVLGMALSVYQMVAELVSRGDRASLRVRRDRELQDLYGPQLARRDTEPGPDPNESCKGRCAA